MSALRIARSALRARPAAIARPIQRRGYAEVASDKIKLSLALPHQVRTARACRISKMALERSFLQKKNADQLLRRPSSSPRMCTSTASPTEPAMRTSDY
jgi:hypothetical protein